NHIRIGRSDRQRAEGRNRLTIRHRFPGDPGVGGFPDAACRRRRVVNERIAGYARHAANPPPRRRANEAILEMFECRRRGRLPLRRGQLAYAGGSQRRGQGAYEYQPDIPATQLCMLWLQRRLHCDSSLRGTCFASAYFVFRFRFCPAVLLPLSLVSAAAVVRTEIAVASVFRSLFSPCSCK